MEPSKEPFSNHREEILNTAKRLVDNTKELVAGAAADQVALKHAAIAAEKTISDLSEAVKAGAGALSLEDVETQVMLLNACKDVAGALGNLIDSTKDACGKSESDPSMEALKNSAKDMVQSVRCVVKECIGVVPYITCLDIILRHEYTIHKNDCLAKGSRA